MKSVISVSAFRHCTHRDSRTPDVGRWPLSAQLMKTAFIVSNPHSFRKRDFRGMSSHSHRRIPHMAKTSPIHSKILIDAACKVLAPIGMLQRGRSRLWLGDHGWWLDVVEFQPSSWSNGSYLNVSCTWLWNVKDHISFDVGNIRESNFEAFENEGQFRAVAEGLAIRAKEKVLLYRALFPSIEAVSEFYLRREEEPGDGWPAFHAAVAHGICGRSDAAVDFLARFSCGLNPDVEWQRNATEECAYLASIVNNTNQFHQAILERVAQTRQLQKLPQSSVIF
jgi:hypothetical protein